MSGAAPPGATWRRPELASAFLSERATLIPLLDVQEDLVRRLLERHPRPIETFLDLGAGDGAMSELVLSVAPSAQALLVDFSPPMLREAERRLAHRGGWRLAEGDLSQPGWREGLGEGAYDAAVSGFAIHHLPGQRKRELFAEVFSLLAPGAIFLNMDYTLVEGVLSGVWDEQMLANAMRAERERGGTRDAAELERDLFDDDDDRPDPAEDQLRWLREAGFEQAELHFKWAEAAVFGAVKPVAGQS
jgi:tRNA (cmo5U34)-methyltransferase